ncbi:MAG: DNA translocase FtsK 4TM domain-containing protein [Nitrospirae bacterium]|nr:DNA translocase FtsK 4TM domain-containing protein [Nitrospirota bacterium]
MLRSTKRRVAGIVLLALAALTGATLFSYRHQDPIFIELLPLELHLEYERADNLAGMVGATWARLLVETFGATSFLFPLLFLAAGLGKLRSSRATLSITRKIAIAGGLLALSGLSLFYDPMEKVGFSRIKEPAGIVGKHIGSGLADSLNESGAIAVLCGVFLLSVVLALRISFKQTTRSVKSMVQIIFLPVGFVRKGLATVGISARGGVRAEAHPTHRDKTPISRREQELPMSARTGPEKAAGAGARDIADLPLLTSPAEYSPPSIALLSTPAKPDQATKQKEIRDTSGSIEAKLMEFGVKGKVENVEVGPVVSLFEFAPAPGVKISRITTLADDLAMALGSKHIRIVAPLPGKSAVGVEVPNRQRDIIRLATVLGSEAFRASSSPLTVALGEEGTGTPLTADIARMPHLLVAGSTGSGKSVALNTIIVSLLFKASPDQVRLILIDPKAVEFTGYDALPHLLTPPISDVQKARIALGWAVRETERRNKFLAEHSARNIVAYNKKAGRRNNKGEPVSAGSGKRVKTLPHIVIIIDELADLMMVSADEVEGHITRLSQMARAAGIHLILATQRPSVDVVTGVIKANLPVRIALKVSTQVDSRVILDTGGAERLLGHGDMLFIPPGSPEPLRAHGAFVTDEEIERVGSFVRRQGRTSYLGELA